VAVFVVGAVPSYTTSVDANHARSEATAKTGQHQPRLDEYVETGVSSNRRPQATATEQVHSPERQAEHECVAERTQYEPPVIPLRTATPT
jgi:hypothetical protein